MASIVWDKTTIHIPVEGEAKRAPVNETGKDPCASVTAGNAEIDVRNANYEYINNRTPGQVIVFSAQAIE